ncbi:hypothetical protein SB761_37235, partial [Pseudomonas sp. SIMBA_064]
ATATDYPEHLTVQALFEAHARQIPHAVAVQAGERQLTYRELNERANQLAFHLRAFLKVFVEVAQGLFGEFAFGLID